MPITATSSICCAIARRAIINRQARAGEPGLRAISLTTTARFIARGTEIFDGPSGSAKSDNPYLARPHNLSNVCAALTVAKMLGLDPRAALDAVREFRALPHRQQEIGEIERRAVRRRQHLDGARVDARGARCLCGARHNRASSAAMIAASTTASWSPSSPAVQPAPSSVSAPAASAFMPALRASATGSETALVPSMAAAVAMARRVTSKSGVVLLSPAAPSYGGLPTTLPSAAATSQRKPALG